MKCHPLPCTGVLLAAIAFLFVYIAGPSIALADAPKEVSELHSVQFKTTTTRPGLTIETILDSSGRLRMTTRRGDVVASISISDPRAGRSLTLYPEGKRAELLQIDNLPAGRKFPNLVEQYANIHDKDGAPVGEKVISGRKTTGFKISTSTGEQTIWADMETRLPVQIDFPSRTEADFQWNPPLDESLFSLTPPAGYELTTRRMDASPEKEEDLLNALKNLADVNGGVYPETFDRGALSKALLKSLDALRNKGNFDPDSPEEKRLVDRNLRAGLVIQRGFKFASDPKNGDDWHYAGMNVPADKAGAPIFWYHPKGSADYHVIDADLKVHEVTPADLPQIPSQAVVNPMKKPAATTNP